jgi:hypothetical protein
VIISVPDMLVNVVVYVVVVEIGVASGPPAARLQSEAKEARKSPKSPILCILGCFMWAEVYKLVMVGRPCYILWNRA